MQVQVGNDNLNYTERQRSGEKASKKTMFVPAGNKPHGVICEREATSE